MADRPYEVGYGRPPQHSRFKPGQSGNPKGRPKGSLNIATALEQELRRKVTVKENGVPKTITKFEAAIKQLVNKAASGEAKAIQFLINLLNVSGGGPLAEPPLSLSTEADQAVISSLLQRFQPQEASTSTSQQEPRHESEPEPQD